jgi:flagellar motor switch protein FliN/FliY
MQEDNTNTVHSIRLAEVERSEGRGHRLIEGNMDLIRNVKVRLTVLAGACDITVKELFDLKENALITLDRGTEEPVEILLDDNVVARGNLVAVGDSFGVQISEILSR